MSVPHKPLLNCAGCRIEELDSAVVRDLSAFLLVNIIIFLNTLLHVVLSVALYEFVFDFLSSTGTSW